MNHPLIVVVWSDAAHHAPGEWMDAANLEPAVHVTTVGWLLNETDSHLVLAQSVTDELSAGVFSIPLVNIVHRHTTKILDACD